MTIEKAVQDLVQSEHFKTEAKGDAKLRVYLGRIRGGTIGNGSAIELLLKFGYKVEVKKPGK